MDLEGRVREFYAARLRSALGGTFHLPEPDGPSALDARASAHHALALRSLDRELATAELRTLYASCQSESGLVARSCDESGKTGDPLLIDPPVAAFAAALLASDGGDATRDLLTRATRQLDAIWAERLPPDTSLPVLLHPLEAGLPGSPVFDPVVESRDRQEWAEEVANLARSASACQMDPERALRAGHSFVVEDPAFCGWFLIALEEARRVWEGLGDGTTARKLGIRGDMIAEAIAERLWWADQEIYVARNRARDELMCTVTIAGLVPAAARKLLEESEAKRAIDRHLRPSASPLWGQRGISENPISKGQEWNPHAVPERGNVASPLAHYWAHLALERAGRSSDARVARTQLEDEIEAYGLLEAFDPDTGEPFEPERTSSLATLVLDMRSRDS